MFDELRIKLRQNKFSTPTNFEANLMMEVLDETTRQLESLTSVFELKDEPYYTDAINIILDKMKFISQRKPLTIEENKNV